MRGKKRGMENWEGYIIKLVVSVDYSSLILLDIFGDNKEYTLELFYLMGDGVGVFKY